MTTQLSKAERSEFLSHAGFDPETSDGVLFGLWLGYPVCCITNFGARIRAFREGRFEDIPQGNKLDGTGFVPCPMCNETKSEDMLREEIAAARVCPQPFPEYDTD